MARPRFRRSAPRIPADRLAVLTAAWLAPWRQLTPPERDRLLELVDVLVHELRWEAANGFVLTDDMRVCVAAHAALLVLGFDDGLDSYLGVTSVIVHPSTIELGGVRAVGDGLYTDHADPVIGEAHHRGPVLVSWDAAADQALRPERGENVLLHEFAHRLDMLDGVSDGTPPLTDPERLTEWVRVCSRSLRRLRAHTEPSAIRSYGATNPSEFFAVATEVFFTRGAALRDEDADLYGVLRDYYRQDPATRRPLSDRRR